MSYFSNEQRLTKNIVTKQHPSSEASVNCRTRLLRELTTFRTGTAYVKTDEMLDIFSTPSNSPYLGGESISFCRSQFPSPSIGGRVSLPREISFLLFLCGDGGRHNLKKSFSHILGKFGMR